MSGLAGSERTSLPLCRRCRSGLSKGEKGQHKYRRRGKIIITMNNWRSSISSNNRGRSLAFNLILCKRKSIISERLLWHFLFVGGVFSLLGTHARSWFVMRQPKIPITNFGSFFLDEDPSCVLDALDTHDRMQKQVQRTNHDKNLRTSARHQVHPNKTDTSSDKTDCGGTFKCCPALSLIRSKDWLLDGKQNV